MASSQKLGDRHVQGPGHLGCATSVISRAEGPLLRLQSFTTYPTTSIQVWRRIIMEALIGRFSTDDINVVSTAELEWAFCLQPFDVTGGTSMKIGRWRKRDVRAAD
ncbi:hypothetical protein CVT26_010892 [Gymnopilus dilepis]|uniref:Uncharacterized protein n=1 Tax=Gymnopilus dilepis TaxID=231916 RepID=A0A409VIT5_9AGAR|nr:hypothetical protein CVT26_010892 [Gymnopilus dilepis]